MPRLFAHRGLVLLSHALLVWGATAGAGEPAAGIDVRVSEVQQLIGGLDSAEFAVREAAGRRLEQLAEEPEWQQLLADHVAAALVAEKTSFEVRSQLESIARRLPSAKAVEVPVARADEIGPLIDRLASDISVERASAQRRLIAMLQLPELVGPVLTTVNMRINDPAVPPPMWRELSPIVERAREAWVTADPASVALAAVSDQELANWVEVLGADGEPSDTAGRMRRTNARRMLVDFVVRDDTRPRVLPLVEQKLAAGGSLALQELIDFAKPAMAAEVWGHDERNWDRRHHIYLQHLLIGVPQFPEAAARATHFDRIDEKTAHCVSGNTLSEGDYPVGVAIPHPVMGHEVMYFLVNLPTPRRRLAYEFHMRRDEAYRLRALTEQTLNHFLTEKHALFELEVKMLCQLDPGVVSRWIGAYFKAVGEQVLHADPRLPIADMTLHRAVCYSLVRMGTQEAIPVLEEAARSGRLGPPNDNDPYEIAWVAALAIARRDPWPGVDTWLADLLENTTELTVIPKEVRAGDPEAELGATAAAILLERHQLPPSAFGLELAGQKALENLGFAGYHFADAESRRAVQRWWRKSGAAVPAVP